MSEEKRNSKLITPSLDSNANRRTSPPSTLSIVSNRSNATSSTSLVIIEAQANANTITPGTSKTQGQSSEEHKLETVQSTSVLQLNIDDNEKYSTTTSEKPRSQRTNSLLIEEDSFHSFEEEEEISVEIVHHRDSSVPYYSPRLSITRIQRLQFLLRSSFAAFFVMLLTHFEVGVIRLL